MRYRRPQALIRRPILATVVSILGGALIALSASLTVYVSRMQPPYLGLLALSMGISVMIASFILYHRPSASRRLGIIILSFSLLSIVGTDGLITGLLVGALGGSLAIIWSPDRTLKK